MANNQTNNISTVTLKLDADDVLKAIDDAMNIPVPIGSLLGEVVYLSRKDKTIKIGEAVFDIDHTYLMGTAIRDAAIKVLNG